ncbi:putative glycoside hydrolase [Rhodococcus sp. IEGM 1408]|uniref:putative glycoside hydrolase n=1 Tax=Rhodococcus sp. IEGM 1408 TaxID=3082220 RepID=UPI002952D057|nr:putative glycoside hydrolase [Rhodococcus sp. IEGM 1408]MDV8002538.1 putative glycoside hydrolase [Rhodococcus sp. IEGM 1408]
MSHISGYPTDSRQIPYDQGAPPRGAARSPSPGGGRPRRSATRRRLVSTVAAVLAPVLVISSACATGNDQDAAMPEAADRAYPEVKSAALTVDGTGRSVCSFWYGIGNSPTDSEMRANHDVVVFNAWETERMRELKAADPGVVALVYKDLSSTRSYSGAFDAGRDADKIPTGLGFARTEAENPEWFARDSSGRRIEWDPFPQHWQMTVWDKKYQRAWADAVVAEVTSEGWDGVLADNALTTLSYYSDAVLEGTSSRAQTDERIRTGVDELVTLAGEALNDSGKLLVPNIPDSRKFDGLWHSHSLYGGGMEEYFARPADDGSLLTFNGDQWDELLSSAMAGDRWLLLITNEPGEREQQSGFAAAALLAGPRTCWMATGDPSYQSFPANPWLDAGLGQPVETPGRSGDGVWTRSFTGGWVALNPTGRTAPVVVPEEFRDRVDDDRLDPGESLVVIR